MESVVFDGSCEGWVSAARNALYRELEPSEVDWVDATAIEQGSLFAVAKSSLLVDSPPTVSVHRVPKRFLELANAVACFRDVSRWALLYRVLWRLTHGEPHVLDVAVDADTRELTAMEKAVGRDVHKMRAFVRFREVKTDAGPWFIAWFEPHHLIVERNAPFFRDRFAAMHWSILTPDLCAHWDGTELRFTPGVDRSQAPTEDSVETLWRAYYGSIFNPARVKVHAMTSEMPRHYWKNLPEAQEIPRLLAQAPARVDAMQRLAEDRRPAQTYEPISIPPHAGLPELKEAVNHCRGCPLWKDATCAVFGEGPGNARVLVVGEQPGDQEDRVGRPFVGPAGQLLNRAFVSAGIAREELYVTNAVKHFKWTPRGKRRLHAKPNAREIAACRPWLEAEIRAVRPELIVCLGATATHSVMRGDRRIGELRGEKVNTEFSIPALITVHPSSLLRLPEGADPVAEFERFVEDLRKVRG